jgi:hypothetical protein
MPELRFVLGDPEIDTTTIDNAASTLESRAFFIRRVGTDGCQIRHRPTLKKVESVNSDTGLLGARHESDDR